MTLTWPTVAVDIAFSSALVRQTVAAQGASWTNLAAYVLGFGYTRGRNRQLSRAEAGTGWILLDNKDGRFDPENPSSSYYTGVDGTGLGMGPRRHVHIYATYNGVTYDLFYGYVTSWEPAELSRSGGPTVRVTMQDMMGWISRDAHWAFGFSSGLGGAQLTAIFNDGNVNIHSSFRNLDNGTQTLVAQGSTESNVIAVAQAIVDSEEGAIFFIDGAGRFTYHDHNHRYGQRRSIVRQALFDNDSAAIAGGALPFVDVKYKRDMVDYANKVTVTAGAVGATAQKSQSNTDISRIGPWPTSKTTRLSTDAQALALAARLRTYRQRQSGRHEDLQIEAGDSTGSVWPAALGLEISDQIRVVERLYPNSRTRTIDSFIEGMTATVDMDRWSWKVVYRLSPAYADLYYSIGGMGVAFPSNPITDDLYYRTDLDLLCFYDGARWLTVHEYTAAFAPYDGAPPYGTSGMIPLLSPWHADYGVYITYAYHVANVVTTNNGSNYWTIALQRDSTTIWGVNTSTFAPGVASVSGTYINAVHTPAKYFAWVITKTAGAPGNMYFAGSFRYRLIVT